MSDTSQAKEIAQEIAREYAKRTDDKIEFYYKQTNESIREMAKSISVMAETVAESSQQLARYEEKQTYTAERMERLEQTQKEQGIMQRNDKKDLDAQIGSLRDEIKDNSHIRKFATKLFWIVLAAMVGGGMLFGSLTGKATPHENTNPTPKSAN